MSEYSPELELVLEKDTQIDLIKDKILARFGTFFKLDSLEMEKRRWEEVGLLGNCGEVARITQAIVSGDVKTIIHSKHNAEIFFEMDDQTKIKLADGISQAFHAYVLGEDNKVWDATLEIWGNKTEEEYLDSIKKQ